LGAATAEHHLGTCVGHLRRRVAPLQVHTPTVLPESVDEPRWEEKSSSYDAVATGAEVAQRSSPAGETQPCRRGIYGLCVRL
jgi:hypothetical protein